MADGIIRKLEINTDQNGTNYSNAVLGLKSLKNNDNRLVVYEAHITHGLRHVWVKTKYLIQYGIIAVDSLIHRQIDVLHWLDDRLFRLSMRLS